jgi:hypothetical protein
MIEKVCEIRRVGMNANGRVQLDLKAIDNTFDWRWFIGAEAMTKEMLAISLAALTAERRVFAGFDDNPAPFSQVHHLFYVK